jgi:hypothetical protein
MRGGLRLGWLETDVNNPDAPSLPTTIIQALLKRVAAGDLAWGLVRCLNDPLHWDTAVVAGWFGGGVLSLHAEERDPHCDALPGVALGLTGLEFDFRSKFGLGERGRWEEGMSTRLEWDHCG